MQCFIEEYMEYYRNVHIVVVVEQLDVMNAIYCMFTFCSFTSSLLQQRHKLNEGITPLHILLPFLGILYPSTSSISPLQHSFSTIKRSECFRYSKFYPSHPSARRSLQ